MAVNMPEEKERQGKATGMSETNKRGQQEPLKEKTVGDCNRSKPDGMERS